MARRTGIEELTLALCLMACSGRRDREPPLLSGSSHPPRAEATADTSGSGWQFSSFADSDEPHPYVILKSASRLTLVGADGNTIAEFTPTNVEHVITASVPGTFVWVDPETIHAVEIPSGRERWSRPVSGRRVVIAVDDAFAVADEGSSQGSAHAPESLILDINTGAVRYQAQMRSAQIDASRVDHAFVFYGESAATMIDDATGKPRWTTKVPGLDGATTDFFKDSIFVVRPDRSYAAIDSKTGRLTEGKCLEAESDPNACLGTPSGAKDRFSMGKFKLERGSVAYAAVGPWPHGRTLLARNAVGTVLWKTALGSCADARNRRVVPEQAFPANEALALLVTCSDSPNAEVMVLGQSDGHIRYMHAFDHAGRLVWTSDQCVLVLEGAKAALNCLDPKSGKPVWSVPVFGSTVNEATAMPLEHGDVLLVDSSPLTVSRIGPGGKRLWQTELPGAELSLRRDSDHGIGQLVDKTTQRTWLWSQGMGVLASSDGEAGKVSVLDLANGKLREIP